MKKLSSLLILCLAIPSIAAEIGVVGLFPGKAILIVDGAAPKTYAIGSKIDENTKLVAADRESATIETNGRRHVLVLGQAVHRSVDSDKQSVTLHAGDRGHFMADARINGNAISMLVDTGASLIALPAAEAQRLGINYKAGRRGMASTAGGTVATYLIKLDSVKIGDIELFQVDASVIETGLNIPLLGMSFLNRMNIQREGELMKLTKRY